jgi:hypothetical protein
MRKFIASMCALLLAAPSFTGAQQPKAAVAESAARPARTDKLPVRRVVLYKNGIGYFEHLGRVRGDQNVTIEFTSGQLNDVLKSLTILDLGKGRITGVNYNSDAPLARRLGALRLPLGEQTTVAQFLGALRGARIEARIGTVVIAGRLLSVERKTRISGGTTLEVDYLSIVTDSGELRTVELSSAVTIRLAERDLNEEVGRYLTLVASTREQDLRRMSISTAGTGERQLYVSYISEVPIWKTTYRLVMPTKAGAKPLLQGWAIVDNTVGEDWEDVELSLVAGAPQSFIQQLSLPYYSRRPVVPLPESAQLTPQTHQATLTGGYGTLRGNVLDPTGAVIPNTRVAVFDASGNVVAQVNSDNRGEYRVDPLPAGNYRVEFDSPGFRKALVQNLAVQPNSANQQNVTLQIGAAQEVIVVEGGSTVLSTSESTVTGGRSLGSGRGLGGGVGTGGGFGGAANRPLPSMQPLALSPGEARAGSVAAAQARELGDLFEYKLKERVTIRKNQSALVPILQTEITAEKVSLWNEAQGSSRPLRAVWLTNSSSLTLDGGSFSVLEDETFAGEGITEPLKPGEKRLLSYAVDLGVTADAKRESERQRVTRVRIVRGVMIHTSEERETKTYTVRNEDTPPRTVLIEHPVRAGWKLTSGPEPAESTKDFYRFRVNVESKKTATLTVNEVRPLETRYEISNLSGEQIALFLRQRSINPEVEAALQKIVTQKNKVAALEAQGETLEEEKSRIYDDQQRLRENLKALKGSAEEKALIQRYTRQLDEQENRLEALKKEITELESRKLAAQAELDKMLQDLALDVTL